MDKPVCFLLDTPTADAADSWVQVAKTGTFQDPRYGKFKITLADFAKWLSNFQQFALADGHLGLPVDKDHSPEKKGNTEAYGWVKQLEQRGNEMWAHVEWNDAGKELIAERRYAYISPSYSPNYKDETGKEHGTALLGIALTNRPFLQMATVNLAREGISDEWTFARKVPDDGDADDVGLQPSDITDLEQHMLDVSEPERQAHAVVVKKINGTTKHMFPIPPGDRLHARLAKAFLPRAIAAGHITDEEAAAVRSRADSVLGEKSKQHSSYSHRQMELNAILTALSLSREALGVAADADDATVLTALATHQAKQTVTPPVPEGHMVLSAEQVATLTSQAAAGAAAAEQLRISTFDNAFESAQGEGKVTLAQKDNMRSMFDAQPDATLKLLSELQPIVSMVPQGVGGQLADLEPAVRQLATEYVDSVTNMGVDQDGLKVLARAHEIEAASKVTFDVAVAMAEREIGA